MEKIFSLKNIIFAFFSTLIFCSCSTKSNNTEKIAIVPSKKIIQQDKLEKKVTPSLKVMGKFSNEFIFLHKNTDFEITIQNNDTTIASNINALYILPKELDYTSSNPEGIFKPNTSEKLATVNWRIASLAPQDKVTLTVCLRGKLVGRCANVAKITSGSKIYKAKAALRVIGVGRSPLQSYDTDDPVEVGKRTIYFIECRNEGSKAGKNLRLVNEIPEEMKLISASGPTKYKVDKTGRIITFAPTPTLEPGEKIIWKIVCEVVSEGKNKGSTKNRATLTCDDVPYSIIDEEGTSIYK